MARQVTLIFKQHLAVGGNPLHGGAQIVVSQVDESFAVRIPSIPGVDEMGQTWWSDDLDGARANYRSARKYLSGYQPVAA